MSRNALREPLRTAEQEKRLILNKYRQLVRSLEKRGLNSKEDKKRFQIAFKMASEAHKTMRRKSGCPYILHPIAVAKIVIEDLNLGVDSAIVALLHDVVEDTEVTLKDIRQIFGDEITQFVDSLTKVALATSSKVSRHAENLKKILMSIVHDPRVLLIKLADRLHNMRTLQEMRPEKRVAISSETILIYTPIAHRLGLYKIKTELEDIAMSYLHPGAYKEITHMLRLRQHKRKNIVKRFIETLTHIFQKVQLDIPYEISGRTKSVYSIWTKMKRKNISPSQMSDIFAIRVVLNVPEPIEHQACWRVFSVINQHFPTLPERTRDWLNHPKDNGYTALHTTVLDQNGHPIEIQIRSKRMDDIAEKGIASHFSYKEKQAYKNPYDEWILSIRTLLENKQTTGLVDALQDFQYTLITDKIFVFTPQGDSIQLPIHSTVLDFAYSVHTHLGERCIGARVNNAAVGMDTVLRSGDRVSILTSQTQSPSVDHLHFLVSPKARKHVTRVIKLKNNVLAVNGMRKFSLRLSELHIKRPKNYKKILRKIFQHDDVNDIFIKIARDEIDIHQIGQDFFTNTSYHQTRTQSLFTFDKPFSELSYTLSSCCNPIQGEHIHGIINRNREPDRVEIHTVGCPTAGKTITLYDCTVIAARWQEHAEHWSPVQLRISGIHRQTTLCSVSELLSNTFNVPLESFHLDVGKKQAMMLTIHCKIENKARYESLVNALQTIEGITSVKRENGFSAGV